MKYLLSVVALLCAQLAIAQTISGTVKWGDEALIGASLLKKGTDQGTITDVDGVFVLEANEGDVIVVSYTGYSNYTFTVSTEKVYDINIDPVTSLLNEVVVTALGLERQSKSLGYVVQQIDAEEINEVKAVNFLDNLTGKLAGVTISQGATGVGSTSKISIRGEASFTNNNPLFVVDGIPVNNNTAFNITNESAAGFQEVDFGNGAMDINPSDVASVSVLKGPAAAALYGTRASNGVIIINTKDGNEAEGLGITFNSTTYVENPFQLPQFQNKYGQGNAGEFEFVDGLGGGINDNITYSYGPELDAGINIPQYDSPVILADGTEVRGGDVAVHSGLPIPATPFVSNPDNIKDFYNTGTTAINNIGLSGKYDKGHYRLSLTDLRSKSIIPGVNLDRNTASARMTFNPTNKLKISTAINYINSRSDNRPANGYGSENINYSLVAWLGRQTNLNPLKEYWQPGLEGVQQYSFNYTFFDNPYLILLENRNAFNRDRIFGNVNAQYELTKNLSVIARTGMDYSNEDRTFRRAFSTNRFRNGAYAEHNVFYREINSDILVNYNQSLSDLTFYVSVGANRMDQQASRQQAQGTSLAQPGVFKLSNAASPIEVFDFASQKRINSIYGIAKIGFKDFLFVDITGRNDWSSALATTASVDNTSFFYPSVSTSFVLSNAVNLPSNISFAKLRASWAAVGNDTNPYQTEGVFLPQTPFNAQPTFTSQSFIANANLQPERTQSLEFGADIRLFDDRLRLDATYYDALTDNQILSLPIAISSGFDQRVVNGGAVRSKGLELLLGANVVRKENFRWNTFVNFSQNKSIVMSLPDGAKQLTLGYSRVYDNVNQTVFYIVSEGSQIGDLWGTGYKKNENGDFVVNEDGKFIVDNTLIKLGNYNPDFVLGWNNQLTIGDLDVSFLIDWRQGGQIVSRTQALAGVGGQLIETEDRPTEGIVADAVVNIGTETSPIYEPNTTAISAESYYRSFYDRNHEENNTYDATYVKLREFSIGYTFNMNAVNNIENLRLALVGRNLFALSTIPHFDPEQIAVQGQQILSGVEDMSYPTVRSFGLNLRVEF